MRYCYPHIGIQGRPAVLENFNPIERRDIDPFWWIPRGLFYDLIDDRNDINIFNPRVFLNDNVTNYTNHQFFNALDADIASLPAYRLRLLGENGNNQAAGVTEIFEFYAD